MLVSSAMPVATKAADNQGYDLQRQEAALDSSVPTQAPPAAPGAFINLPDQTAGFRQPQVITRTTFSPVSQVSRFHPAYDQNDLFKTLNGWSATITVEFTSPVSSKIANVGDLVEAKLTQDFRWGPQLIAAKESLVRGHVTESHSGRTLTHSAISSDRRLKSRGVLAVQFDEIIDINGKRWPIQATPSPRQKSSGEIKHSARRTIEADSSGRIVKAESELAGGLKNTSNVVKVVNMVPVPGTILFTSLAPAVAMGAVGAASPSIAYDKPVDENTEHRRMKGAAYGFVSSLPGAFVVKSVVEKGNEVELSPGDLLTLNVCIKDTGYRLPPGEQLAVNGKVMHSRARSTRRLYPASNQQASAGHSL